MRVTSPTSATNPDAAAVLERAAQGWEIEWFGSLDSTDRSPDEAPLCELPEVADAGEDVEGQLSAESLAILASLDRWIAGCVGAASMRELRESWARALRWAQRKYDPRCGSFTTFGRSVAWTTAQRFLRRYTRVALYRERRDDELRRTALRTQATLAAYLTTSRHLIEHAQLAYPRRWHVPGMTGEDVVGELTIRLLDHVRSGRSWEPYQRVAREATFVFFDRARRALTKRRQIYELTENGFVPADLVSTAPTPEDTASSASTARYLRQVYVAAAQRMSGTQRSWFNRMRADVHWNGDLNEARIAAQIGRSRSAASRAKDAVRDIIIRELGPDWDGE